MGHRIVFSDLVGEKNKEVPGSAFNVPGYRKKEGLSFILLVNFLLLGGALSHIRSSLTINFESA